MHEQPSILVEQNSDGLPAIRLTGEIGPTHAAELHRMAVQLAEQDQNVVVDCEPLESLDLSSLQILIALRESLASQNKTMRFAELSAEVSEMISLAGLRASLGLDCDSSTSSVSTTA